MKRIICCTLFFVSLVTFSQSLVRYDFMDQLPRTCDDIQNYQFNYPLENGMGVKSMSYLDSRQFQSLDLACIFPLEYKGNVKSILYKVYVRRNFLSIYGNAFYNTNHELIFFESKGTHSEEYMYGFDRWSEIRGHEINLIPCIPNSFTYKASPTRDAKGLITNVENELVYSYDSQGRVIKVVYRNGEEGTYKYEYVGISKNIRKISVYMYGRIGGDVTYGYENGHIVRVDCNVYYSNGPEGNIETEYHKYYKYDDHNNISEIVFNRKDYSVNERTLYTFVNTYDAEGKLSQSQIRIKETGKYYPRNEDLTRKYTYDTQGNWIKIEDDKGCIIRQIDYWTYGNGEDRIYTDKEVSVNATFGNSFANFYKKNPLNYDCLNGTFVVEKDGSISVGQIQVDGESPKNVKGINIEKIEKEFEKLNWIPATINGKPVRSYVDVAFKYQKNKAIVMKDIIFTRAEYDAYKNAGDFIAQKEKLRQVEKIKEEALERKPSAVKRLGIMYLQGDMVEKDTIKGMNLLLDIAEGKIITYKEDVIDMLYENKEAILNNDMLTKRIANSKFKDNLVSPGRWEEMCIEASAKLGNRAIVYKQNNIAKNYGPEKQIKWLEMAIKYFGDLNAMYSLALIYIDNSLNLERGIKLLTKVADSGNLDACYLLGLKYKYGNGVTKDKDKAKYYLKKAKGK